MVWGISNGTVLCAVQLIYVVLPGCLLFVCYGFPHAADCRIHAFNSVWFVIRLSDHEIGYIFHTEIGIREIFVRDIGISDVDGIRNRYLFTYRNRESKKNCNTNRDFK